MRRWVKTVDTSPRRRVWSGGLIMRRLSNMSFRAGRSPQAVIDRIRVDLSLGAGQLGHQGETGAGSRGG
jgi:hypothetical protein